MTGLNETHLPPDMARALKALQNPGDNMPRLQLEAKDILLERAFMDKVHSNPGVDMKQEALELESIKRKFAINLASQLLTLAKQGLMQVAGSPEAQALKILLGNDEEGNRAYQALEKATIEVAMRQGNPSREALAGLSAEFTAIYFARKIADNIERVAGPVAAAPAPAAGAETPHGPARASNKEPVLSKNMQQALQTLNADLKTMGHVQDILDEGQRINTMRLDTADKAVAARYDLNRERSNEDYNKRVFAEDLGPQLLALAKQGELKFPNTPAALALQSLLGKKDGVRAAQQLESAAAHMTEDNNSPAVQALIEGNSDALARTVAKLIADSLERQVAPEPEPHLTVNPGTKPSVTGRGK